MKNLKNVFAVSLVTLSMAFAGGVGFSMNSNWTEMDADAESSTGYSVMFGFNNGTSVGYDSAFGMLATFGVVAGADLRLGWGAAGHTVGMGYDFWSTGDAIKTSLGLSINYTKNSAAATETTTVGLGVGFGF